jgi:hypothetical protein
MCRWTKPGGYAAVQDYHIPTMELYLEPAACFELVRAIVDTQERSDVEMEFAFKAPALFVAVGIGVSDGTDMNLPMRSLEPFASMFRIKLTSDFGAVRTKTEAQA